MVGTDVEAAHLPRKVTGSSPASVQLAGSPEVEPSMKRIAPFSLATVLAAVPISGAAHRLRGFRLQG